MEHNYEKLFQTLSRAEPPPRLFERILTRIELQKKRAVFLQLAVLGSAAGIFCVALIPAFHYAAGQLYQSEFSQYFSLIFSDSALALANWKEYILTLVESLPLMGMTVILSIIFILFVLINRIFTHIKHNGRLLMGTHHAHI